jgi:hypothetical protein
MSRTLVVLLAAAALGACDRNPSAAERPTSRRERDSVIAQSRLPHASAVRSALRVEDAGAARVAREDSASNTP